MNNSVYKKDFDEITDKIKLVMGNSTEINFILLIIFCQSNLKNIDMIFPRYISEWNIKNIKNIEKFHEIISLILRRKSWILKKLLVNQSIF